jgi:transcriptional regulator with XRE-family HTH domain
VSRAFSNLRVADRLGADPQSVNAWELNYRQPSLHLLPAIIRFLNRGEGEVEEERLLRVVLANPFDRIRAYQARDIAVLVDGLGVAEPVALSARLLREVVDLAQQWPVLVVEAALARSVFALGVPEVPLAEDLGLVSGLLQGLRQ